MKYKNFTEICLPSIQIYFLFFNSAEGWILNSVVFVPVNPLRSGGMELYRRISDTREYIYILYCTVQLLHTV